MTRYGKNWGYNVNKELREKVNKAVSDNLDYDFMIERIINICADEAIDAVKSERNNWESGGMAELGVDCSIDAIKKAIK